MVHIHSHTHTHTWQTFIDTLEYTDGKETSNFTTTSFITNFHIQKEVTEIDKISLDTFAS